jgi:hypothetical protein
MNPRACAPFLARALFGLCLIPAVARGGGWDDILKPDYKRVYDPRKQFEAKPFSLEKEFTIKSFPAEKSIKTAPFPVHTFRLTQSAPADSKSFVPKQSALPENNYRVGNWPNSERSVRTDEITPKESSLSSKTTLLTDTTVPPPESAALSKTAPDAAKIVPQPRVMDEETARKLIEKLYGPMGGRSQ